MLSKHLNEVIVFACERPLEANIIIKKQWILSPLRGSRMTGYGMTFGGIRGQGHLGVGVESNEVRARGRLPPAKTQKKKPPWSAVLFRAGKGFVDNQTPLRG